MALHVTAGGPQQKKSRKRFKIFRFTEIYRFLEIYKFCKIYGDFQDLFEIFDDHTQDLFRSHEAEYKIYMYLIITPYFPKIYSVF